MATNTTLFRNQRPGPAALVIALHSSGSSPRQWQPYRDAIAADVELLTPDLLGYDTPADWPSGAPVSLDDEARRLAPLLYRGQGPVDLVGHSYGASVALQIALRWPECVRSLTLYEPIRFRLLERQHPALWREILSAGQEIARQVQAGTPEAAAMTFVDYWSGPGTWSAMNDARRHAIVRRMPKVRAEFGALFDDTIPATSYGDLPMHVRVMIGGRSPEPARRAGLMLAEACPRSEVILLPSLGHMGPVQDARRILHLLPWAGDTRLGRLAA